MFGFGNSKPDPMAQLITLNARVNDARQYGTPLQKGDLDTDDQTVYDCDNYAHDKLFAQDWPQGVTAQTYDVDLPPVRGQAIGKHRVLVATVNGSDYILDNMTNAVLPREEREKAGWVLTPYKPAALHMAAQKGALAAAPPVSPTGSVSFGGSVPGR